MNSTEVILLVEGILDADAVYQIFMGQDVLLKKRRPPFRGFIPRGRLRRKKHVFLFHTFTDRKKFVANLMS